MGEVTTMRVTMLDQTCDRCGKTAPELHPYHMAPAIKHRGKWIVMPWLCPRCYRAEKEKSWNFFYEDLRLEMEEAIGKHEAELLEVQSPRAVAPAKEAHP